MNSEDLSGFLKALRFAANKHRNQRRKDKRNTPYINHPIEVCYVLTESGSVFDPAILTAAILHDTLEDTRSAPEEIRELFGSPVLDLVKEVTDDKHLPRFVRKRLQVENASTISDAAKQIKLADKISNIRDILENPPWSWNTRRKLDYINWAEQVAGGLRGVNKKLEDKFDELVRISREKLDKGNRR
ncbi:MAG: bifunctional (p)ppGpp synthetase/guanosine-3',5'-bis(diphosphate) 3'-pyrophosphohydrolase [Bacteroidales bacterium]|nr:MAG: bifunctional (p)ppGpp synthetase/guanosine-3',5'-bis(diphosphate) 3'-pyrophosphohydrolase [Bacteroidales bacterium]